MDQRCCGHRAAIDPLRKPELITPLHLAVFLDRHAAHRRDQWKCERDRPKHPSEVATIFIPKLLVKRFSFTERERWHNQLSARASQMRWAIFLRS